MRSPKLAVILLLLLACGPSADQKAASTLHATLEEAHAGFVAWDLAHQRKLIEAQPTPELKHAAVDAYRRQRLALIEAFIASYSAVDAAIIKPSGQTLGIAFDALRKLTIAISDLKGPIIP